jgi:hypothetical protein
VCDGVLTDELELDDVGLEELHELGNGTSFADVLLQFCSGLVVKGDDRDVLGKLVEQQRNRGGVANQTAEGQTHT